MKLSSISQYSKLNLIDDEWFVSGHKANYLKSWVSLFYEENISIESSNKY